MTHAAPSGGRVRAALLLAAALAACELQGSAQPPVRSPQLDCAELRNRTGDSFRVDTAEERTSGGADGARYCRITGLIPPEVRFEVSLPASWNGRFAMGGNAGWAGVISPTERLALRGFATAATDAGHQESVEPEASFALDREKLLDYGYRSLPATARAAKRLIEAYYGAAPAHSYFVGCSTGGRQGLILAQRFPEEFDGVLSGAPILDFTGTVLAFARNARALAAAPIPPAKLGLLAERVYRECDARDGLADGVIDDPRRCEFEPARDLPRCAAREAAADCFSAAQIEALETLYADVVIRGRRIFPGWPPGAEVADAAGQSGWVPWLVGESEPSLSARYAETFLRYLLFPGRAQGFDPARFDAERDLDPERLAALHEILDASDPDLGGFRRRGGKLIMYYGWADATLNPRQGVEYYESVLQRSGPQARDFFRLFMVPGMFHCHGGVGTGRFDLLPVLIDWVERGAVPERIDASRQVEGRVVRTRPLCPYPETARYLGTGSSDDASRFRCEPPR